MTAGDETAYERAVADLDARGPGRMLPDLSRIAALSELLGDPQLSYPSVHVTGTNGKGSVVRMVSALCSAAGFSAGSYTSPHLQTVRERLSFAGRPISRRRFADLHEEVSRLADLVDRGTAERGTGGDHVTYFELLTAMASWWFAELPVDVGVFEVGMGGRWDATNLVRGDVAVINAVDVDHPELGATPAEVAREKSGIIKPGAQVVVARQRPEVREVIEAAAERAEATLWRNGEDLEVLARSVAVGGQLVSVRVRDRVIDDVLLPLFGAHQAENAALAVGAFAALTGAAFDAMEDDVVRHGLGAVTVPGRLEIVHRAPTVVLDGAHNPHGAGAAAAAMQESFGFRELVVVAACLQGKDVEGILAPFRSVASHVVVSQAPSPRAVPLEEMQAAALGIWEGTGTVVEAAAELERALEIAESVVGEGDGILVTGSLHTVGAARDRYVPVDDLDDDEVVLEPEDDAEPIGPAEAEELADLLGDEEAFREALEHLGEDEESE